MSKFVCLHVISRTKTAFLEVIMTIDKFMKENNMHQAIKSRIMAFYELQWQYNSVRISWFLYKARIYLKEPKYP